jgi:hypothetical protein
MLMLEGKTCSLRRSYTILVKDERTGILTKASTQSFKAIRYEGIEQLKQVF